MIVCSCNVLSDAAVRRVLATAPRRPARVLDVHRRLGCHPQCGSCVPSIRALMKAVETAAAAADGDACEARVTVAA
jgi:bacterioferritin-associated ferredoxin